MLVIINEILTFKDNQIRARAQPTIVESTVDRARRADRQKREWPSRALALSTPHSLRIKLSMADILRFNKNISIRKIGIKNCS